MNLLVCKLRGFPVIRSIQDIYPDTLVSQRYIQKSSFIYNILLKIEKFNYRNSSLNVFISSEFHHSYLSMIDTKPLSNDICVPNWGEEYKEINQFDFLNSSLYKEITDWRDNAFLYVFGGNFSTSAATKSLLLLLKDHFHKHNIKLLLAGSGAELIDCVEIVETFHLEKFVKIISPWHKIDTDLVLSSANAFVLPSLEEQNNFSVPSKIIDYIRIGRPILAIAPFNSSIFHIITDNNLGFCCKSIHDEDFLSHFLALSSYGDIKYVEYHDNCKSFYKNTLSNRNSLNFLVDMIIKNANL